MSVLRAQFARWWHCLARGHCEVSWIGDEGIYALGCDCGRVFYLRDCDYNLRGTFLDYLRDVRARRIR